MAGQPTSAAALAVFLAQHQQAIAAAWACQLQQLADPAAAPWPAQQLEASTQRGVAAISATLRTGSFAALADYLAELSATQHQRGLAPGAALEQLLLCKEAISPLLADHADPHLYAALPHLDACLRRAVRQLSECAGASASQHEQQAEHLAVVTERQRLAHDLHDSVAQALYSLTLYSAAARKALHAGDQPATCCHLHDLETIAFDALREMRLLIFNLRPPVLEEEGLAGALQQRIDSVETRAGLHASLRVQGSEPLTLDVQEALYHVAQEALTNVLRHAAAQHVTVSLEVAAEQTRLEICDDGVGCDPATLASSGGLGVRGMHERIAELGGTLTVHSAPNQGTRLVAEVPR